MKHWTEDKRWADRFMSEIKQILGLHLIGAAPEEEDCQRNTDLIVLRMDAVRIACRVRKNKYLEHYAGEFTIRSGRPNGSKTELQKVIEGWGNYLFYGIANENESRLAAWTLGNLSAFRLELMRNLLRSRGQLPGIAKDNRDGSSSFHAFRWADFPGMIVASSESLPPAPIEPRQEEFPWRRDA